MYARSHCCTQHTHHSHVQHTHSVPVYNTSPPAPTPTPAPTAPTHPPHQRIAGVIHRITYNNPKNKYTVLKLKPLDSTKGWVDCDMGSFTGNMATVTAFHPNPAVGHIMEFFGTWSNHKQYGLQFIATEHAPLITDGGDALVHQLLALKIRNVGPVTARCVCVCLCVEGGCCLCVWKGGCCLCVEGGVTLMLHTHPHAHPPTHSLTQPPSCTHTHTHAHTHTHTHTIMHTHPHTNPHAHHKGPSLRNWVPAPLRCLIVMMQHNCCVVYLRLDQQKQL